MKNFDWGCDGTGQGHKMYKCRCYNVEWLGSVANCIYTQGDELGKIQHALAHVTKRCLLKADVSYSVDDMTAYYENATNYLQYPTDSDLMMQTYYPLSVNTTAYEPYRRTFNQMNHHVFKTQWFGWGLVYFWVLIIALYTLANIGEKLFGVSVFGKRTSQWWQKHLMPATPIYGLSRLNILILFLFIVQATLSTALSYTVELPNMYINDSYFLTLDLIGYRSGIISFALMPVTYIFGVRNNPFCFMTGLPLAEFMKYHKLVAIIMSLEALVHSAVWTAYAIRSGGYLSWSIDDYWRWGVAGTVVMFVMMGQSLRFIRNLMYESFLIFHKSLGWMFIITMWYHCDTLGWMGWIYSIIAITAYDRVMRFVKTFILNRGFTSICITIVEDGVLKVTIPKPMFYDVAYVPGSHLYLSFFHWPIWYQCFQSHPFTVLSSPVESAGVLTVYVRVKKGVTKTLSKVKTDEKGRVWMYALIDGPYGTGFSPYNDSDYVVGIAGGLGVCSILPHMYDKPKGSKLLWAINNLSDFTAMERDLEFLREKGVDVEVFYTSRGNQEDYVLLEKSTKYLTVLGSRPDVDSWVTEAITEAKLRGAPHMYVVSCGPGSMDKDVSKSVLKQIEVGLQLSIHHKLENLQW